MRHLVPLALVYALVAALVLPGSLLAAEEDPASTEGQSEVTGQSEVAAPPAETAPGGEDTTAPAESTPPEPAAPAEPAAQPAPAPTAPAQEAAAPAQAQAPAEPAADERPVARAAAPGSVTIQDFSFSPASVTVNVGDSVTWTNRGPSAHSATGDSFDTGVFPRGGSRSQTFQEAGTFSYVCTPHPQMQGTVRVLAASSGGGGGSGGADDSAGGASAGSSDSSGSAATGSGAALPNSGADTGALALLGLMLLVLGVATRRRAASQAPAHPGRIGW